MNRLNVRQLGQVQETLLIPLWARAAEQDQPEPIVLDAKASQIAAALDYDFRQLQPYSYTMLGCCIRAQVFDAWIREFLATSEQAVVVEIGPGLDTSFERLDDGRVVWHELEFPDVLELRRCFFAESPRRRLWSGSALSGDWVDAVRESGRQFLFVAAGVLMYLPEQDVRRLFALVAEAFPGALFVFDACTPWAQRTAPRREPSVRLTDAEFRWGIGDPRQIEDWDPRYQVLEVKYHVDFHPHRWPRRLRLLHWFLPATRRHFTLNLARLG